MAHPEPGLQGEAPLRWTPEQDAWLEANAHRGAARCARDMAREFGVCRTGRAVERHGTRIGVSWKRYEVCPECGMEYRDLNRKNGLCPECSARMLRNRNEERWRRSIDNQAAAEVAAKPLKREADKYKKRISRINTGRND